jgi:Dyp-type peroxidase family
MINLDLADIQGNIHRPYGRFGFPYTRHLFFNIGNAAAGRRFVQGVRPRVTTAEPWEKVEANEGGTLLKKPPITLNIGFTCLGLHALELPTRTLRLLPDEFIDGMGCRADILGDVGQSAPDHWNRIWNYGPNGRAPQVHIWISFSAGANPDGSPLQVLTDWTLWIEKLATDAGGITLLDGHGADGLGKWQDSVALMAPTPGGGMVPIPKEHFGFTDGISDPVFRGQLDGGAEALAAIGGGKIAPGPYDRDKSWSALETGEFILGQVDEGQEFPVVTEPAGFARNGTFMVWRKLRQDVETFDKEVSRQAALWKQHTGVTDDEEACQTIRAKMVGRWQSGIPLAVAPSWADHQKAMAEWADCFNPALRKPRDVMAQRQRDADFALMLSGFRYGDDPDGSKCPLGAHIRRANPRDMLDPRLSATVGASTLTNRRRLIRRGLPYADPDGEKGIVFMGICSSLFRQFEFIQQQWINYGLDFEAGNDSCPVIGSRAQSDKHVIPAGSANAVPFIAAGLPEFVTTRGGDYFFLPSLSAIRMIAMGTVDPT